MAKLVAILLLLGAPAFAADGREPIPISGYEFMEPATRQLQDDDFLNPAFFLVDEGLALWNKVWDTAETDAESCRACHADPATSMRGVAARYPRYDAATSTVINLEMKINSEIVVRLGGEALVYESEELLALTALIGFQSRSLPMSVDVDENSRSWLERGREIYETKRGQLNLSCKDCHQDHWGEKLRGDTISQGQINAFPLFRLTWGEVGSRHRIFTWCMESVRSEPYEYGSEEYLALELYLAVRGQGLPIETPGVRR
jgi:sulfur-oxidizing protein SoxA